MSTRKILFRIILLLVGLLALFQSTDGFGGSRHPFRRPSTCPSHRRRLASQPLVARRSQRVAILRLYGKAVKVSDDPWYQFAVGDEEKQAEVERDAVRLCGELIRRKLGGDTTIASADDIASRRPMIKNRFMDLACSQDGEAVLESLFDDDVVTHVDDDVLRAAVMVMQSVCVFGTQVGVKGTPEQLNRMVSHLDARRDPSLLERDLFLWDADSVRRLKHRLDRVPAVQLLSEVQWKRTTQGAFDLLNALGAWDRHEDLALLRSGFPLRFSEAEIEAANAAAQSKRDPDQILGIRRDLRHLKVYTIDSAATSEIDDGISIERIENPDGTIRDRIWIHIADADRWAPRDSDLFRIAQKRITSLYLPRGTISMFPPEVNGEIMSLKANQDNCALSLSAEVNDDGSIDPSSISVMPSLIHVTYRLTYVDVDDMLEEGIGYREEWELGAMLDIARKRRNYRCSRGSSESLIPNPIPYNTVDTFPDNSEEDGIGISVKVEVSHNAGQNITAETGLDDSDAPEGLEILPCSSSFLLVTEAMILAGEAIGRFKVRLDKEDFNKATDDVLCLNRMRLPFRTQPPPDFKSRARERRKLEELKEFNVGGGLCYAWYARRFLLPVKVSEHAFPHSGLGLDCYVQWTSPIRRFSDLQSHASVKRALRRQRLAELLRNDEAIPPSVVPMDFGFPMDDWPTDTAVLLKLSDDDLDQDMNFLQGVGLIGASRTLQRQSQKYWLFEYIDRCNKSQPDLIYTAVVLGCVDPERQQYAIYVYELGLEHRYTSPSRLDPGIRLRLKVDSVYPRLGLLSFVRSV